MKLPGDPVTLLFLGLNQSAAHVCKRRFRQFGLRNIRYHAYNPQHLALFVEVRATGSLHPNRHPVGAYHAMADTKVGLFDVKRSLCGRHLFQVVRVNLSRGLLTRRKLGLLIGAQHLGVLS